MWRARRLAAHAYPCSCRWCRKLFYILGTSKIFTPTETREHLYPTDKRRGMNIMTSAALSPIAVTPQMEPANFLNLLIVDDERSIREACREVAQSLGFTTFVADSAEHAYRLLDSQTIDAVLLDLRLPG